MIFLIYDLYNIEKWRRWDEKGVEIKRNECEIVRERNIRISMCTYIVRSFIYLFYMHIYEYTFGLCKSDCMFMMRIEDFILNFVNFEAWLLKVNIDEVHTGVEKKFKIGYSGSFKSVIKHGVNSMLQELLLQQS